ncbi:hypothetical protein Agub_g14795 [Astrephomene gubernaculifera]|uniref:Helicase C-terminal domain-containing protein n=1 Tax=Astrephomene gubernaculifera TaxID=47775 RepID=A0AAD3E630_9CHLO|nr:hypothetical protein Agub_g14795 [Astrephomene gubernaculifera]
MMELFSILSLLDPDAYPSPEDFAARFGGAPGGQPPSVEQIKQLQSALAPVLLRRMKEDVEELPQKEEVVIWVELSAHQRTYYRAIYEGQIGALLGAGGGAGGEKGARPLAAMRNLAMELRKLCCHPVLCDGLEEDLKFKLEEQRAALPAAALPAAAPPQQQQQQGGGAAAGAAGGAAAGGAEGAAAAAVASADAALSRCPELELLVRGSGKMVLLHKLLPKLRAEGRRVLIFSQFVIMLNVLEDYCRLMSYPVERIDGNTSGRERQQAIDRFCAEDSDSDSAFVFLLSTRAGGQGITLTAADTCIIYDSDWNPQNDLQAMARCHRIGQKKEVTVYRLISRDTYEMALFKSASKKYGLDEAILGFSAGSDPEADAARISDLLRHGAHGLLGDMEAGARQGEAFAGEDINQILEGRTEKRQIGSRAGNTFSVATFALDDANNADNGDPRVGPRGRRAGEDDKEYWRSLLPEAVAAHEAQLAAGPQFLGRRKRAKVNYNINSRKFGKRVRDSDDDGSDGSASSDDDDSGGGSGAAAAAGGEDAAAAAEAAEGGKKGKRGRRSQKEGKEDAASAAAAGGKKWTKSDVKTLEDRLMGFGPDRYSELYAQLQPTKRSPEEVEAAARALWALYCSAAALETERRERKMNAIFQDMVAAEMEMEGGGGGAGQGQAAEAEKAAAAGAAGAEKAAVAKAEKTGSGAAVTGGAGGAAAGAAPASGELNEWEQKLMEEVEKLPEYLRKILAAPPTVRRILRDAVEATQHAKAMVTLAALVRPDGSTNGNGNNGNDNREGANAGGSATAAAAAGPAAAAAPTYHVPYLQIPPSAGLPGWWGRADDEALLQAAVQVGYTRGYASRRTAEHALRNPPLAGKFARLKPLAEGEEEQEEGQAQEEQVQQGGQAPQQQQGKQKEGPPPQEEENEKQQGKQEGTQQQAQGQGQQQGKHDFDLMDSDDFDLEVDLRITSGGAGEKTKPQRMTQDEWRQLISNLTKRLSKVVQSTLDRHRGAQKRPVLSFRGTRKSAGAAAPTQAGTGAAAAPTAATAAASKPTSAATGAPAVAAGKGVGSVPASGAAARVGGADGGNSSSKLLQLQQQEALATVLLNVVSQHVAASQQQNKPPSPGAAAGGAGGSATAPAATSGGQQQKPQQQQPRLTPTGDSAGKTAGANAAAGGGGGSAGGKQKAAKRQSLLPFARLGPSSKPSTAAAPVTAAGEAGAEVRKKEQAPPSGKVLHGGGSGAVGVVKDWGKTPAAGIAAGVTVGATAAAVAAGCGVGKMAAVVPGVEPGSAEKPIEIEESD